MLASLGLHAAALFVPDIELSPLPAPEPLQAEIVLQPRQAPVPVAAPPQPVKKAAAKPQAKPRTAPAPVAETAAVSDSGGGNGAPVGSEAQATAAPAVSAEAPAVTSPGLPAAGSISYAVYRGGEPATLIGSAEHRWEMAEGRYRIVSVMETTGVAAWVRAVRLESESRGRLVPGGLEPEYYSSRRLDKERGESVAFDREKALVRFGNGATAPLPAGAQDLLSFNYQLGWLARTGDLPIATGRRLGNYRLELLGKEWVETPMQPIWTLHFRAVGETTTEVWLAPDNHLLPVKIRHIDKKGERFEQVAQEIRLEP